MELYSKLRQGFDQIEVVYELITKLEFLQKRLFNRNLNESIEILK